MASGTRARRLQQYNNNVHIGPAIVDLELRSDWCIAGRSSSPPALATSVAGCDLGYPVADIL